MDDRSPAEHEASSTRPAGTLLCRACAYDLHGLDSTANCPECGTPVARTLAGDALSHADPEWVGRLANGLWIDAAATGVALLLLIPLVTYRVYEPADGSPSAAVRAWLVYLLPLVLTLASTWLVTTPEPGVWAEELGVTLRRALRFGVSLETGIHVVRAVGTVPSQDFSGEVWMPLLVDGIGGTVLLVMWWVFLRRILLRGALLGLALAARFTMVALLVATLVQWLPWLPWALGMSDASMALDASATAAWFGHWAFTVPAAVVVVLSARALRRVAATHPTGQNPAGGSSSQAAGSPDRG